jgi:hypothetical protein
LTGDRQATHDIDWVFHPDRGSRSASLTSGFRPSHAAFHFHERRFLVLSRDRVTNDNLVWKDTVLVRTGETVDILLDTTTPATGWLPHAEHVEGGMMLIIGEGKAWSPAGINHGPYAGHHGHS